MEREVNGHPAISTLKMWISLIFQFQVFVSLVPHLISCFWTLSNFIVFFYSIFSFRMRRGFSENQNSKWNKKQCWLFRYKSIKIPKNCTEIKRHGFIHPIKNGNPATTPSHTHTFSNIVFVFYVFCVLCVRCGGCLTVYRCAGCFS